jgi:hypothetical protein
MKANELRIGNYFYPINRGGEIHLPIETPHKIAYFGLFDKVIACKPDENICCIAQPNEYIFNDMSEITLTKEWLVKFGFEKSTYTYNNETSAIYKKNDEIWISENYAGQYCLDCHYHTELKYVHQWQNLYFALTGEELIIKQ